MLNEETGEVVRMRVDTVPPFTSFIVVPVWFGGRVISIIEVGWRRLHPLLKDDARLLDSVARYLSIQLAGAFATLRARRADRLASLATELREELLTSASEGSGEGALGRIRDVFVEAGDELDAAVVTVR